MKNKSVVKKVWFDSWIKLAVDNYLKETGMSFANFVRAATLEKLKTKPVPVPTKRRKNRIFFANTVVKSVRFNSDHGTAIKVYCEKIGSQFSEFTKAAMCEKLKSDGYISPSTPKSGSGSFPFPEEWKRFTVSV